MKKFKNILWYVTFPFMGLIVIALSLLGWIPIFWLAFTEVIFVLFNRYEWWCASLPKAYPGSTPYDKTLWDVWCEALDEHVNYR